MKEKIKVKIVEESLWDRLPQYVKDEINGIINSKPKEMVEVVRGEWIVLYDEDSPQDGIWKCSVCDYIRFVDDITPTNYCPNCGAKMDKE